MDNQPNPNAMVEDQEYIIPPVNICESKDEVLVEAEMPGVDKSRLEVTVQDGNLQIVGRRSRNDSEQNLVYQEIPRHDYRRVFSLGDHINQSKIQAAFDNGILTLRLAKAEEAKPQKIQIEYK